MVLWWWQELVELKMMQGRVESGFMGKMLCFLVSFFALTVSRSSALLRQTCDGDVLLYL